MPRNPHKHPWLYEKDGSLNPTWILVVITYATGIVATVAAIVLSLTIKDSTPLKFAFGFIALTLLALLGSALPRDRAKILLESKVLAAGIRGVGGAGGALLGIAAEPNLFVDDERDDGRVG